MTQLRALYNSWLALFIVVSCATVTAPAMADDSLDECSAAAVRGQKLRRDGHFNQAALEFARCADNTCRADIVKDCAGWLEETRSAAPSIVVAVHDDRGLDVLDAVVRVDNQRIAPEAAARAISLDPGPHSLVVSRPGAVGVTESIVLREGEKMRAISVQLPSSRAAIPPEAKDDLRPPTTDRPIPASVYVFGALGVASLGTFGVAAAIGDSDWSRSNCGNGCLADDAGRVRRELLVADVALGIGLVASGIATWLYLQRPSRPE